MGGAVPKLKSPSTMDSPPHHHHSCGNKTTYSSCPHTMQNSSYTCHSCPYDSKDSYTSSLSSKESFGPPYAADDNCNCSGSFKDGCDNSSYNCNSSSYSCQNANCSCGDKCACSGGSQGVAAPPEDAFMSAVLAFCSHMSGRLDTLDNSSIYDEFRNYTSEGRKMAVA